MAEKTMVYGVQHNAWSMDGGQSGITSLLFIQAEGDTSQGIVGQVPTPVKADSELTKALIQLRPIPFPCLCEVEHKMVANRKGMTVSYTKCTPVAVK
ncbi:MAG: hypothetical protein KJ798_02230 [Gammaproteobacteria bacterium]|jgi:hypothetical protein|nr:hypothetical protein [Gammaproteobacteria bacterium]MBU0849800.1 hypothetical protein [Gammaproteobacteria bacterium]MBU1267110.1 hypothetical protein [Gammaproteobacteria bacterium]MBU1527589.1 hypothetical protein [Gammaproteobacteria bacterium]MBU1779179.1 hypothetical protein [Gammaproteobacteria bacterium]